MIARFFQCQRTWPHLVSERAADQPGLTFRQSLAAPSEAPRLAGRRLRTPSITCHSGWQQAWRFMEVTEQTEALRCQRAVWKRFSNHAGCNAKQPQARISTKPGANLMGKCVISSGLNLRTPCPDSAVHSKMSNSRLPLTKKPQVRRGAERMKACGNGDGLQLRVEGRNSGTCRMQKRRHRTRRVQCRRGVNRPGGAPGRDRGRRAVVQRPGV